MQKFFLHAGPPKTGTTLIQAQLFAHRKALRERGYVYIPNRELRGRQQTRFRSYPETNFRDMEADFEADFVSELQRRHATAQENVIFSWEEVLGPALFPPRDYVFPYVNEIVGRIDRVAKAHNYELHFIFYVRRQDEFLESWATQRVQAGNDIGFQKFTEEFVDAKKISWMRILQAASDALGPERTHGRVFETIREGAQAFMDDFLSVIDPALQLPYDDSVFSNQSFSALAYQVALEGFKYMPSRGDRRNFAKFLQLNCGGERYGKCKFLSSSARNEMIAFYEKENREVFEKFGLNRDVFDSHYTKRY